MLDSNRFDFFSGRLHWIDLTGDPLLDRELWHYLSAFENHVYGAFMQYSRIRSDLRIAQPDELRPTCGPQAGLDIYYYILTWDKLKKIYDKIKAFINRVPQSNSVFPNTFRPEFRDWRKRVDHLFSEFDIAVRNEYEHPSLESHSVGNIIMWGSMMVDGAGDITAHAGKDWFATVKNEHCTRIQDLRTDLIDLFVKHFSQKPITKELIRVRSHIEENIESILEELKVLQDKGDTAGFNNSLHNLLMHEIYLSKEGVPLAESVIDRFHSVLAESGQPR